MMNKWHQRFLNLAKEIATWSKDPSTKCGAIIVSPDRRILATGYNGLPTGYDDFCLTTLPREEKYKRMVHAEMNAVLNAAKFGVKLEGATIYVHGLPICCNCAKHISSVGINTVVVDSSVLQHERWKHDWEVSKEIFKEVNIKIVEV